MIKERQELKRLQEQLNHLQKRVGNTIYVTNDKTNLNIIKNAYDPVIYSQKLQMDKYRSELSKYLPNLDKITSSCRMNESARLFIPSSNRNYYSKITKSKKPIPFLFIDSNGVVKAKYTSEDYAQDLMERMLFEKYELLESIILSEKDNPLNKSYDFITDNLFYPDVQIDKKFIKATNEYAYAECKETPVVWYHFFDDQYNSLGMKNSKVDDEIGATINQIFDHILIPYYQLPNFIKTSVIDATEIAKKYGSKKRQ